MDLWTTELLYVESEINHYQTVDYKYYTSFECREDQCHAGKTCKCKTFYICIGPSCPTASMLAEEPIYRFYSVLKNRFSVFFGFLKTDVGSVVDFSKPRFRFGFRLTDPPLVHIDKITQQSYIISQFSIKVVILW